MDTSQKKVKQKTVVTQVMHEIKEYIIDAALKPGEKLPSEAELASNFNISRTSIREALKIFQYLGIVEASGPKGSLICKETKIASETLNWSLLLADPSYEELLELRLVMERQGLWYLEIFKKDDRKIHDQILSELIKDVEKMKSIESPEFLEERLSVDFDFHSRIVSICRNPIFDTLYKSIRVLLLIKVLQNPLSYGSKLASPETHKELIEIIKKGDYIESYKLFRNHVISVK